MFVSVLHKCPQAVPEERGEQLRHQHQDNERDPQRNGHLARQDARPPEDPEGNSL